MKKRGKKKEKGPTDLNFGLTFFFNFNFVLFKFNLLFNVALREFLLKVK